MSTINLENILTDNDHVKIFEKIHINEKKLLNLFKIIFITIFILINGLIFFIYHFALQSNSLIFHEVNSFYHMFSNFYIAMDPFSIIIKNFNNYYDITSFILIFILANLIYLTFGTLFYYKILFYINDMKMKIQTMYSLQSKNEKDLLSARIIQKIAEHLNHEIKPPLLSIKNLIKEYEHILSVIIKLGDKNGNSDIDKIIFPSKKPSSCKHCSIYNEDSELCKFYSWYGKSLPEILEEFRNLSSISLNQIFKTLEIIKDLKSLKQENQSIVVYDVIEQSIRIFYLMRKYKFDYKIDENLKKCYLNGLNPEIFSNIIMNHIKNSLEANATYIQILFQGYIEEKGKKFIIIEIIDNGNGIPNEILDKIYEIDFSTKSKTENSGVGLYLSKQILQYYGGNEKVKFTNEDGTIFCLKIPVRLCDLKLENPKSCRDLKGE